ncbi:type I-F CRISPR-associated helicase Cas3f [Salinibius halmophilus]|uniref:type I-F CRISPR-associated helicase Cas3f n=1 Tax=Salinibius halmophilus TaxID=1853216 RepID=UPI000E66386B|nr:type I-F CRISPR-associated helicase Cas3f [Salinibius halmophilus]
MMVTFVSQCEKRALAKTRRVLDAFANRIGDNTWQTIITEDGLKTVQKMLRQSASRSTAVSCHWLRSRSRSELIWIVGNRSKFALDGTVPVNTTKLNLAHGEWEHGWRYTQVLSLAAAIGGLFHDIGKANALFQKKLSGKGEQVWEPYRHEWVSFCAFLQLVDGKSDKEWLTQLAEISQANNGQLLDQKLCEALPNNQKVGEQFDQLASFAQLVAWLILSHHRLPLVHVTGDAPDLTKMKGWKSLLDESWNSANREKDCSEQALADNWHFPNGTPLKSSIWQHNASNLAQKALNCVDLFDEQNWLNQRFVSHIARMSLMLADHYYSSLPPEQSKAVWRDSTYTAVANTDRKTGKTKQQLDEHNIGVGLNALKFARNLPTLKLTLPALADHKFLKKKTNHKDFLWQNTAAQVAKKVASTTERQGFFGINMASTGCGKTVANAKIMYALADPNEGCRFSVALGLRTLTLQTGDSYRNLLKLDDDALAVLIGSQKIQDLHQLGKQTESKTGSDSANDPLAHLSVQYDGQIYDGRLKHWLAGNPKLEKMLSAPVMVSTIDHLMPATESLRGGKQIAPMLRLLTSDLVLDEPDDFSLADMPALSRLVNWAGMLGSRLLLSTATMPPALAESLFESYCVGRKYFDEANFNDGKPLQVQCAWFDEFSAEEQLIKRASEEEGVKAVFAQHHQKFIDKRLKALGPKLVKNRLGTCVPVIESDASVARRLAETIHQQIHQLHAKHHQTKSEKLSIGVVRFANIDNMVAVVKELVRLPSWENTAIHYCVYHSQFPLAMRSAKEAMLDRVLDRHDPEAIWQHDALKSASDKQNRIYVVLGTSVVEVGRDHDYDWAVVEPSSLRSIIQLAGRIQRHRKWPVADNNIAILNQNFKALLGKPLAFEKPGFETKGLPLVSHQVSDLMTNEQLQPISAQLRIQGPNSEALSQALNLGQTIEQAVKIDDFWLQEHRALAATLNKPKVLKKYRTKKEASLWWTCHGTWAGEFIRQTQFRRSDPQETFVYMCEEDGDPLTWHIVDDTSEMTYYLPAGQSRFNEEQVELATDVYWWQPDSAEAVMTRLANQFDMAGPATTKRFGELNLRAPRENEDPIRWHWHEQLGVFRRIKEKEQA